MSIRLTTQETLAKVSSKVVGMEVSLGLTKKQMWYKDMEKFSRKERERQLEWSWRPWRILVLVVFYIV